MTYAVPVYMGQFDPVKAGDVVDKYLDIATELVTGETVATVAFTVTDAVGAIVPNVVGAHTDAGTRTDFRLTAPAVGVYTLTAVFIISDGQKITRYADLWVV